MINISFKPYFYPMKKDIENKTDIELLIRTFYGKLLEDEFMAPHFKNVDFEHHFPRMIGFWAFVLLDEPMNIGNVFDKHRNLKIDERHFERWIKTFSETVDQFFEGKIADKAKQNAKVIGYTFQSKMKMS
jgi:hemoglobin